MSGRKIGLGPRPERTPEAEVWVRGRGWADGYTARLTIDVTPEMRSRIKVIAFQAGLTVAQMVRELFEREYGQQEQRDD